jgi:hypothetical protein
MVRIDLYQAILSLWSFGPFRYPFLDLIYVGAGVECFHKGIDVYLTNPCDPLDRVHDYSPLWLRMTFLLSTKTWLNVSGLALAALPRLRRAADTLIVILFVASPVALYALERGNVDVAMFILAVLAVVCLDRAFAGRLVGYIAILIGGLLKFFPFVLFALLCRERPRVAVPLGLIAVLAMGGFAWIYRAELPRMAANIPMPDMFAGGFGARQLPVGLTILLRQSFAWPWWLSDRIVFSAINSALIATCGLAVWRLSRSPHIQGAVRALTSREALSLLAGALLVCGCFFAGRNITYRAINLLLTIPSLLVLARAGGQSVWLFRTSVVLAVSLIGYLVPERLIYDAFGGDPTQD